MLTVYNVVCCKGGPGWISPLRGSSSKVDFIITLPWPVRFTDFQFRPLPDSSPAQFLYPIQWCLAPAAALHTFEFSDPRDTMLTLGAMFTRMGLGRSELHASPSALMLGFFLRSRQIPAHRFGGILQGYLPMWDLAGLFPLHLDLQYPGGGYCMFLLSPPSALSSLSTFTISLSFQTPRNPTQGSWSIYLSPRSSCSETVYTLDGKSLPYTKLCPLSDPWCLMKLPNFP